MDKHRIYAIWSAILDMLKIANMTKKEAFVKFRCIEYKFKELEEGKAEIQAQLEGDSTYVTMVCGSGTINSGKMFTGESQDDFLPIETESFKTMLVEFFPKHFKDEVKLATQRMQPPTTVNAVVSRIQEMRAKQESASIRTGGMKFGKK